jgi:hypothetical protein
MNGPCPIENVLGVPADADAWLRIEPAQLQQKSPRFDGHGRWFCRGEAFDDPLAAAKERKAFEKTSLVFISATTRQRQARLWQTRGFDWRAGFTFIGYLKVHVNGDGLAKNSSCSWRKTACHWQPIPVNRSSCADG